MRAIRTIETDVLVVGAGPTGLTASAILANAGVNAITITRYASTAHTPRAHITNKRTMEVFRDLGFEERVRATGFPLKELHNNLFVTTLAGLEIGRYKSYGASDERQSDYAAASPSDAINCPQHLMEPVLLDVARERGADIRFSQELVDVTQDDVYVYARILERETSEEYQVRAQYLIGADGARSRVAEQLGFEFDGQAGLKGMANAWLEVDLSEFVDYRPGVLYWTAEPGRFDSAFGTASWVNVKPWNEWSLLFPWEGEGLPSEEEVLERASHSIGATTSAPQVKVKSITKWYVNNVVARDYRKGRVFLAGDAAHRHPPTGGLGTNTSVQDAFNLCWKLTWVLNGDAGDDLLESYSAERQPVGQQVVDRAIQSWHNMASFVDALGLRPDQTAEDAWAVLHELFESSPTGMARRDLLKKAIAVQKYRSNALGVELGQRYTSGAVLDDGTPFPASTRDPELYYHATSHPGAYLPHAWVERDRTRISTLDLVGHGEFTLLVGSGGASWREAAAEVGAELGIDLTVHAVGMRAEIDDVTGDWEEIREITDNGALLVRPDRHIAWRAMDSVEDPVAEVRSALRQVLARNS